MIDRLIGWIWGLVVCGLISLILGGCSAHRTLVSERARYDTVWMVSAAQTAKSDSVVVRERVEIVPKLIRVGDTTILHRDTTIVRVVERNVTNNRNFYTDKGRVRTDTVSVVREVEKASPGHRIGLLGILGIIGSVAVLAGIIFFRFNR